MHFPSCLSTHFFSSLSIMIVHHKPWNGCGSPGSCSHPPVSSPTVGNCHLMAGLIHHGSWFPCYRWLLSPTNAHKCRTDLQRHQTHLDWGNEVILLTINQWINHWLWSCWLWPITKPSSTNDRTPQPCRRSTSSKIAKVAPFFRRSKSRARTSSLRPATNGGWWLNDGRHVKQGDMQIDR